MVPPRCSACQASYAGPVGWACPETNRFIAESNRMGCDNGLSEAADSRPTPHPENFPRWSDQLHRGNSMSN